MLEHAEGWRISSQPTKVESNRQYQRSPKVTRTKILLPPRVKRDPAHIGSGSRTSPRTAACRDAKVEAFRFRDLRHTLASHFTMSTGDLSTLQKILGRAPRP